jgi:putative copper resistance protein D
MIFGASVLLPLHADPDNQPPPLTALRLLTVWTMDWWVLIGLLVSLGLYLWGVRRLHKRGDKWPVGRTIAWCVGGMGTIAIATFSSLGAYDTVLFSVHMVQHMLLNMIAPVFMALGAPFTLLLRNTSGKAHRNLVVFLHSWFAKLVFFPPLATGLMVFTPFVLYLTPLYEITLENDFAHAVLHIYMLAIGCMFFWPLLGIDPMPNRFPYPLRILLFFITMPFHAFLGVTIMGSTSLIAEDWYLAFNRFWPPSPMEDQSIAGGIMWATGDFVMFVIMTVFFVQWLRDSQAEARREDRRLDRIEAREAAAAAAAEAQRGSSRPPGHPESEEGTEPSPNG